MFEELFKDTGIAGVLDSAELSYESSCAMLRRETLPLRWSFEKSLMICHVITIKTEASILK